MTTRGNILHTRNQQLRNHRGLPGAFSNKKQVVLFCGLWRVILCPDKRWTDDDRRTHLQNPHHEPPELGQEGCPLCAKCSVALPDQHRLAQLPTHLVRSDSKSPYKVQTSRGLEPFLQRKLLTTDCASAAATATTRARRSRRSHGIGMSRQRRSRRQRAPKTPLPR